jgi:hypothetical protein
MGGSRPPGARRDESCSISNEGESVQYPGQRQWPVCGDDSIAAELEALPPQLCTGATSAAELPAAPAGMTRLDTAGTASSAQSFLCALRWARWQAWEQYSTARQREQARRPGSVQPAAAQARGGRVAAGSSAAVAGSSDPTYPLARRVARRAME